MISPDSRHVTCSDPGVPVGPFLLSRPMVRSYHSQGNGLIREPKAILYYDYFLTFPKEVEVYWCAGSYTWASIVFLANRYVAVLGHLPLFYVNLGNRGPCTRAKVGLNFLAFRCFLILSSVSTCESLNLDSSLVGAAVDLRPCRLLLSAAYHGILTLILATLTESMFHVVPIRH